MGNGERVKETVSREMHRNDSGGHCFLSSIEGLALFSDAVLSVFRDYKKVTRYVCCVCVYPSSKGKHDYVIM